MLLDGVSMPRSNALPLPYSLIGAMFCHTAPEYFLQVSQRHWHLLPPLDTSRCRRSSTFQWMMWHPPSAQVCSGLLYSCIYIGLQVLARPAVADTTGYRLLQIPISVKYGNRIVYLLSAFLVRRSRLQPVVSLPQHRN